MRTVAEVIYTLDKAAYLIDGFCRYYIIENTLNLKKGDHATIQTQPVPQLVKKLDTQEQIYDSIDFLLDKVMKE